MFVFCVGCSNVDITYETHETESHEERPKLRAELPGEIVFVRRDERGFCNVYATPANSKRERLIFKNEDSVNSNCLFPEWSEDGTRIQFTAMEKGKWRRWSIGADGSVCKVLNGIAPKLTSRASREKDINVISGSIYVDHSEKPVYALDGEYGKFNTGASEVSWGPDKEYIIIQLDKIVVVELKTGKRVEIAEGSHPSWK